MKVAFEFVIEGVHHNHLYQKPSKTHAFRENVT